MEFGSLRLLRQPRQDALLIHVLISCRGRQCFTDRKCCTGGFGTCCLTYWCPCVAFGQSMEKLSSDECMCGGNCAGAGCLWMGGILCCGSVICMTCMGRTAIRKKYNIDGDDCSDCLASLFCHLCVLIQVIIRCTVFHACGSNRK
jgi:Cys-rich protein (TIGR01571 family)